MYYSLCIIFMVGNMAAFDMSLSEAVVSPGKKNLNNFEFFFHSVDFLWNTASDLHYKHYVIQ